MPGNAFGLDGDLYSYIGMSASGPRLTLAVVTLKGAVHLYQTRRAGSEVRRCPRRRPQSDIGFVRRLTVLGEPHCGTKRAPRISVLRSNTLTMHYSTLHKNFSTTCAVLSVPLNLVHGFLIRWRY